MCGRFAASTSAEDLVRLFEIDDVDVELPGPAYNIAPTDPITVVLERRKDDELRRRLTAVRWGLVPSWSRDARGAARLINARVETVAEKPSFRRALAARRCLIPADGYFEWRAETAADGKKIKQPYFLRPGDGSVLTMAGLYEFWKDPAGRWLVTAAIITTRAVDVAGQVHDRMPMTVGAGQWDAWLAPQVGAEAIDLLIEPANRLSVHAVSMAVNNVDNDGPELLTELRSGE